MGKWPIYFHSLFTILLRSYHFEIIINYSAFIHLQFLSEIYFLKQLVSLDTFSCWKPQKSHLVLWHLLHLSPLYSQQWGNSLFCSVWSPSGSTFYYPILSSLLRCRDCFYLFRVTQLWGKLTYSRIHSSCVAVLSVSLWMRNKDSSPPTIYVPFLPVCLVCSFCSKIKQTNKQTRARNRKQSQDCIFPDNPVSSSTNSASMPVMHCGHLVTVSCSSLIFKTLFSKGIFCLFVCFAFSRCTSYYNRESWLCIQNVLYLKTSEH